MAAGLATLNAIEADGFYPELFAKTTLLVEKLQAAADAEGIPMTTNHVGSMWGVFFTDAEKVSNYEQVMSGNIDAFNRFFHGMLHEGIYLAPACYEAAFMSAAHTEQDIDNTVTAATRVFKTLKE